MRKGKTKVGKSCTLGDLLLTCQPEVKKEQKKGDKDFNLAEVREETFTAVMVPTLWAIKLKLKLIDNFL